MDTYKALSAVAGIVFIIGFIPYIRAILKGETKPAKVSWTLWASLDTVTLVGMYSESTLNGQIIGAAIGAWTIAFLAFKYGTAGWTKLDKFCLGGALLGIGLWIALDSPLTGIIVSSIIVFIAAIPTFKAAWSNPAQEDKTAWTIYWVSCVIAVIAIPAWTLADAVQPTTFFFIESVMMYIVYMRPRALARS